MMFESLFASGADFGPDTLTGIILFSLGVSLSATVLAAAVGLPFGAVLAIYSFPGRRVLIVVVNALLGLPPVVVGLVLYLLLSRSGPLGGLGLLFTPAAMVLTQAILAAPIVTALVRRATENAWEQYGAAMLVDGASRAVTIPHLLAIERAGVIVALLAGFGRTISEVGGILIVGGNIAGHTRTMTTSIVLETSKGNLAIALSLGVVLIAISMAASTAMFAFDRRRGGAR